MARAVFSAMMATHKVRPAIQVSDIRECVMLDTQGMPLGMLPADSVSHVYLASCRQYLIICSCPLPLALRGKSWARRVQGATGHWNAAHALAFPSEKCPNNFDAYTVGSGGQQHV
jgi:hypothetical protein